MAAGAGAPNVGWTRTCFENWSERRSITCGGLTARSDHMADGAADDRGRTRTAAEGEPAGQGRRPVMGTATMRRVTSRDGTEIACWTSGEGPPLVVVHGVAGCRSAGRADSAGTRRAAPRA